MNGRTFYGPPSAFHGSGHGSRRDIKAGRRCGELKELLGQCVEPGRGLGRQHSAGLAQTPVQDALLAPNEGITARQPDSAMPDLLAGRADPFLRWMIHWLLSYARRQRASASRVNSDLSAIPAAFKRLSRWVCQGHLRSPLER